MSRPDGPGPAPARALLVGLVTAAVVAVVVGAVALVVSGRGATTPPAVAAAPATTPSAATPSTGDPSTGAGRAVDPLEAFGTAAPLTGAPQARPAEDVAVPTTVSVPAIGVESTLGELGVAQDGTVEVPVDYDQAGWFTEGPRPGQRGPAVILGHVDSRSGPAVFAELASLVPGDRIAVGRADGSTATFAVDRLDQVPKDEFPSQAVYGPVPDAALRLITCGGDFDPATGHYRDNVVVYASLVG